jgi:hypothetical protein
LIEFAPFKQQKVNKHPKFDNNFNIRRQLEYIEYDMNRTLDEWKERMKQPKPHKCAAIFIDNSGLDVVLGILPFAEELLR